MKNLFPWILLIFLLLFSCSKESDSDISGDWYIIFSVSSESGSGKLYTGILSLIADTNQLNGTIIIDDDDFFVFSELISGISVGRSYTISFETYAWLIDERVTTLTLDYSGMINTTSELMEGVFSSADMKIGEWYAVRK
jgi:hypothetical protein